MLRYFSVYGPRQRPDMAFNRFCHAALEGEPITVFGDGTQTRDFTYVADVVAATRAAAEAPAAVGGVYNIGGGARKSLAEALELIAELAGRELEVRHERPPGGRRARHRRGHLARPPRPRLRACHRLRGGPAGRVRVDPLDPRPCKWLTCRSFRVPRGFNRSRMQTSDTEVLVSVVIPCLNEVQSVGCLRARGAERARALGLRRRGGRGGQRLDRRLGRGRPGRRARGSSRRVGAATAAPTCAGFEAARGRYVVMGDADGTYDFDDIPRFVEQLEEGADFVVGLAPAGLDGAGRDAVAAPPRSATRVLTAILNLFFRTGLSDTHCGMRAFRREHLDALDLRTTGMEFASEQIIRASKVGLRVQRVPDRLPPPRRALEAQLVRRRLAPPAAAAGAQPEVGVRGARRRRCSRSALAISAVVIGDVSLFGRTWEFHALAAGALLTIAGSQVLQIGLFARVFAARYFGEPDPGVARLHVEQGLLLGALLTLVGLAVCGFVVGSWMAGGLAHSATRRSRSSGSCSWCWASRRSSARCSSRCSSSGGRHAGWLWPSAQRCPASPLTSARRSPPPSAACNSKRSDVFPQHCSRMPLVHADTRSKVLALGAVVIAFLLLVPAAGGAPSRKKAMWGPVRVDGVSQFPIYDDLGVGHLPDRARRGTAFAPDPARQSARPGRSSLRVARAASTSRSRRPPATGSMSPPMLVYTPSWANGGKARNWAPTNPAGLRRLRRGRRPALPGHPPLDDLGRALAALPVPAARPRPQAHQADSLPAQRKGPRIYARILDAAYARSEGRQQEQRRDRREHVHHRRHLAAEVHQGDEAAERQAAAAGPLRA